MPSPLAWLCSADRRQIQANVCNGSKSAVALAATLGGKRTLAQTSSLHGGSAHLTLRSNNTRPAERPTMSTPCSEPLHR
jgi:hypothetical protein